MEVGALVHGGRDRLKENSEGPSGGLFERGGAEAATESWAKKSPRWGVRAEGDVHWELE